MRGSTKTMIQMVNGGGGSSYYGETAADLDEPFSTEFDLLSSLCAKEIFMNFESSFPVKALNTQVIKKRAITLTISLMKVRFGLRLRLK